MIVRLAVLATIEIAWLALVTATGWGAPGVGAVHGGLTIAAVAVLARWRAALARPGGSLLWVGVSAGPLGALSLAVALPVFATLRRRLPLAGPLPVERALPQISYERFDDSRIAPPDPDRLGSLMRAMRHGSVDDRQAAIETAIRSFEPRLSVVIQRALVDRDQTIRALAASASTRVLEQLAARRTRLTRAAAESGDPADQLTLAEYLADHALHNLLASATQRARLTDSAVALLATQDGARARALLATLRPEAASGASAAEAIRRLYAARDWAGLARRCALPDAAALPSGDPLAPVVALWREHAA